MIKAITGTKDILPSDINKWLHLEEVVRKLFTCYNYKEIRTPIFEDTSLFARGIGEETDIVSKEMYTFIDRGGTSLTLKPEMTASVVRAFIEHSLGASQPLNKLFYISPMFRQERPQAGRFRQFHQFGAEALGSQSPLLDAEMIQLPYFIFKELGLKHLSVKINSLGETEIRDKYKKVLRDYLSDKIERLSPESKKRFETNILRIFDSKDETDIQLLKEAPKLIDYLDDKSRSNFETVKQVLKDSGIPYEVDTQLVRGLDYYTQTTFEIVSSKVGSQSALCGGGRYDFLVEELGGKSTPGVGFASGIERVLLALENEDALSLPERNVDIYIIRIDETASKYLHRIANELRNQNLVVDFDYLSRSMKAQMREANKFNANFVLFLGGEELERGLFTLKNMKSGKQDMIGINTIFENIKEFLEKLNAAKTT